MGWIYVNSLPELIILFLILTICYLFVQRILLHINKGDHGFSNEEMDMKMIFRAFGPDFRNDFLAEPFDSVSIYPLMCKLLGVVPEANNGSLSDTKGMLVDNSDVGKHLIHIWFDSQKRVSFKMAFSVSLTNTLNHFVFIKFHFIRLMPFLFAGGSSGKIQVSFTLLILMIVILTFIWRDLPNYMCIATKHWMHLNSVIT